ncbi:uncharacterized protein Tco025E_08333 [Trypanosoma conorhini]|uniref:Uncharacterized protein n=1 Tax=Trypanosoma conorhini TaxID=83891 RepID=A0A422NB99_9TRYP|nr:uncharacterized protein Tco025E_08333 [Trypanosoma conorhini]RNF02735.1 hypothetical protein Tco025E_08333 [Trypanosoma conorhini]
MSADIMLYSSPLPKRHFDSTAALRQAVLCRGDEYSEYERLILEEVNALRRDPVGFAAVVEAEATVGYPFVRDDPLPAQCSEMTLEQLRVYVEDFQRERREVKEALRQTRKEWSEAEAAMKERWGVEDVERAKKARRSGAAGRKQRSLPLREEDYVLDRQRAAQELTDRYTQQTREANARLLHLERSCKWAIDGANLIIKCVQELREVKAVPELAYSRSLTLAARDIGNESHQPPLVRALTPRTSLLAASSPQYNAAGNGDAPQLPQSQSIVSNEQGSPLHRSSSLVATPREEGGHTSFQQNESNHNNESGSADMLQPQREEDLDRANASLFESYMAFSENCTPLLFRPQEASGESEHLAKAAMRACSQYGYYSGVIRGLQLCGAFAPRKMVIQILLGARVSQFTVQAQNPTHDASDSTFFSTTKNASTTPLLWVNGRLFGGGWVRSLQGTVSATILVAASFEELSVIHERRDFTLPQLHRILNSPGAVSTEREPTRPAVVHIQSSLGVAVVEPVAHPILVGKEQRVARVLVQADPSVADLAATVCCVSEAIPTVPLLDRELLLVQRSRDNIQEVEILLDTQAAWHRWPGHPLLVHLFERDKNAATVGAFTNIGFVRVTPTQRAGDRFGALTQFTSLSTAGEKGAGVARTPPILAHRRCEGPREVKEEPHGWPLVTMHFQELCATVVEPLRGTLIADDEVQHVAIQVPEFEYLQHRLEHILLLLEKEQSFFEWEAASGSQQRMNELIAATMSKLKVAEEELREQEGPTQQELAQLQKSMVKKRGKEMARLKRQEEELLQRTAAMKQNVEDLRQTLADAQEDLVQLGREYTLRVKRQRNLRQEYERLSERANRAKPLPVEVVLVPEDATLTNVVRKVQLRPTNDACTLYEGDVRLTQGFKGNVVLFVNEQETVRWELRPGY